MESNDRNVRGMLREEFVPSLPYGFAERVARAAMEEAAATWRFTAFLAPRLAVAMAIVAVVLAVAGFTGDGPGVIDAVAQYQTVESLLPLP